MIEKITEELDGKEVIVRFNQKKCHRDIPDDNEVEGLIFYKDEERTYFLHNNPELSGGGYSNNVNYRYSWVIVNDLSFQDEIIYIKLKEDEVIIPEELKLKAINLIQKILEKYKLNETDLF